MAAPTVGVRRRRKCRPRRERKWYRRGHVEGEEEEAAAVVTGKMAAAGGGDGEEDEELRELLESALDDFDKAKPSAQTPAGEGAEKADGKQPTESLFAAQDVFFHELFDSELAAEASKQFDKAMQQLAVQEPQLIQHFHKLSEIAGKVGTDPASNQEFSSCLQQTLSGLAKNASGLQSADASDEELSQAMGSLGMDLGLAEGGAETDSSFLPIMQAIMQNLLSKDILYPSLKEITDKYPDWLAAHRDTLPKEEFERYKQQHTIMGRICQHFEAEGDSRQEQQQQRPHFDTILELMQQLQDLGEPPKELAEMPPGLNFDLDGMSLPENIAAGTEQCAVM